MLARARQAYALALAKVPEADVHGARAFASLVRGVVDELQVCMRMGHGHGHPADPCMCTQLTHARARGALDERCSCTRDMSAPHWAA